MRHCIIALGMAVLFATTGAFADAKEHFRAGQSYYDQGRYNKAIEEFEEAYRLDPRPLLLFNIAQSHEKLGNLTDAVTYLEKFLELDSDAGDRASIEDKIHNLKTRVAATGITVKCNEDGASIIVDRVEMGKTPYEGVVPLLEGAHKVTITKQGFTDFVMNIAVSGGRSVPIDAKLEPGKSAALAVVHSDAAAPTDTEGDAPAVEEGGNKKSGGFMVVLPWIVTGVGAVTAGVGWGVVGSKAASDNDHGLAVKADIIGIAGSVVAAGGLAWGIISLIKRKKGGGSDDSETAAIVVPFADRNTAGVAAAFTF